MGKVVKLPKKKNTYQVHVRAQIVTYMMIEATSPIEARRLAVKSMPYEFSVDSFDSELDEVLDAEVSIFE